MFANHSFELDNRPASPPRASRAHRFEIAPISRRVDLARCEVLFIDYDDWVAAYLHDHGVVIDAAARTTAFVEQQAPALLAGRGRIYAAHVGGRPAGVLALHELDHDTAEVTRLFVRTTARHRGIARGLLERASEDARSLGYRKLQARVLPFMTNARRVYEAAGFEQTQQLDALTALMERKL